MFNIPHVCIPSRRSFRATLLAGVLVAVAVGGILFLSSYRLFSSPETWMDEGLIIQSAIGLLSTGKAALPIAPGIFEPAWYITTGLPVTMPLAAVFAVFGVSLEGARMVMLAYLCALFAALWLFIRKAVHRPVQWASFFLLILFAPLYGNGRNVLGEIPGLFFLLCTMWLLTLHGPLTQRRAVGIGLFAGLAVATKPIFILLVPALLISFWLRRDELYLWRVWWYGVMGFCVPLLLWIYFQFGDVSLLRVFQVYANPHDASPAAAILANLKRLVTEAQPFYFGATILLWLVSYGVRKRRGESVLVTEEVLLFFSLFVAAAYLRTVGFYRYFFLGEVFSVLYLPSSLWYLMRADRTLRARYAVYAIIALMLLSHGYTTFFRSWTATHYDSQRTALLEKYFAAQPVHESLFIYQAPELVTFAWGHPFYQYVRITPSIEAGADNLGLLRDKSVGRVVTSLDTYVAQKDDVLAAYERDESVGNYVVLSRKQP